MSAYNNTSDITAAEAGAAPSKTADTTIQATEPSPNTSVSTGVNEKSKLVAPKEAPHIDEKFKKLEWPQLTVCLIVEAIALGATSIAGAFANVGMVAGVILCIGIGFLAIYTSDVAGRVYLKYPHVVNYPQAIGLIWGRFGRALGGFMLVVLMTLLTGGHTLTGAMAFYRVGLDYSVCAIGFSIVSAIILFVLALPPTFHTFRFLGYIDFVSIMLAIILTIVGVSIAHGGKTNFGGVGGWELWPPADVSFTNAFEACTNLVFAYSYIVCQFTFMREMRKPTDFRKSIWALGMTEMFIYTVTGAIIYAYAGSDVKSPALLSAGPLFSRIAMGVALPVIFISGSINTTVAARYLLDTFATDPKHENILNIRGRIGWGVWIGIIATITLFAWIIAEAIPYFSPLLGIMSALFLSGFNFYFPALFWFCIVKEGKWYSRKNIFWTLLNASIFLMGIVILIAGTYTSVTNIILAVKAGGRGAFSCSYEGYI